MFGTPLLPAGATAEGGRLGVVTGLLGVGADIAPGRLAGLTAGLGAAGVIPGTVGDTDPGRADGVTGGVGAGRLLLLRWFCKEAKASWFILAICATSASCLALCAVALDWAFLRWPAMVLPDTSVRGAVDGVAGVAGVPES